MNKLQQTFAIALLLFFSGCAYYGDFPDEAMSATEQAPEASTGNIQPQPGIITAGEWNDLDHWDFWTQLLKRPDFERFPAYWQFYTNHRVSVVLASGETPVVNARVELFEGDNLVWAAKTDHAGQAELWIDLFQRSESVNLQDYVLRVNGVPVDHKLSLYENGVNRIQMRSAQLIGNRVDLSFIVDATGSMGDELEFLKDDLENVIRRVEANNTKLDIYTSSVFYRDQGDKYVVRKSDFSDDLSTTLDFINKQSADGGGDFPEAVHTALKTAIDDLQWSDASKTKIAFLILDAPPHYAPDIVNQLHASIEKAARKGIKVIPITASGIDQETEVLMRFFAAVTNGTYVFITDDSGVGEAHLQASVGEFQVEYLNDLMVRLISAYTE